jgi:biotin-(acetyl-CoA carboxylase) ligase
MQAHGYQRLDPQEVMARELAESWVQIHKQWQEAVYGVEEELLMEEARDIKKEARHRGLTERVNALLRERKFGGDLIT